MRGQEAIYPLCEQAGRQAIPDGGVLDDQSQVFEDVKRAEKG